MWADSGTDKFSHVLRIFAAIFLISFSTFFIFAGKAEAVTIFITSTQAWAVPSDWSNTNTIEVIGGGGGGGAISANGSGGGGGGAYAKAINITTITAGSSIGATVGAGGGQSIGGGDSFLCNSTLNCA